MTQCNRCGNVTWPGQALCGDCKSFERQVQKDYKTRRVQPQPQRVVQQAVYVPYPVYQQPQQQYYPQQMPQYGYQQPAQPQPRARTYEDYLPQTAGGFNRPYESIGNYGLPPSADNITDDRRWHPLYFFVFGLWLALLLAVIFPFIYLIAIWNWGRVLLCWILLGIW